jgi:hypothetical protein
VKAAVKAKLNVVSVVMLNSTLLGHDAVSIGFHGRFGEVSVFIFTAHVVQ